MVEVSAQKEIKLRKNRIERLEKEMIAMLSYMGARKSEVAELLGSVEQIKKDSGFLGAQDGFTEGFQKGGAAMRSMNFPALEG